MKMVDSVIDAVRESGVECAALVSITCCLERSQRLTRIQTKALQLPTETEMQPKGKFTFPSAYSLTRIRQVHSIQPNTPRLQKISAQGAKVDEGQSTSTWLDESTDIPQLTLRQNPEGF